MTYKRWKEIRNILRSPHFNYLKLSDYGMTKEEFDMVTKIPRHPINAKYSKKQDTRGKVKLVGCLGTVIFCVLFWWIPIALVQNYYETKAIENLTGKDVGYWDVLWAGDIIRANAELQNKPK